MGAWLWVLGANTPPWATHPQEAREGCCGPGVAPGGDPEPLSGFCIQAVLEGNGGCETPAGARKPVRAAQEVPGASS